MHGRSEHEGINQHANAKASSSHAAARRFLSALFLGQGHKDEVQKDALEPAMDEIVDAILGLRVSHSS